MTEQQLIDAIHQAKLDYNAATTDAERDQAQADSITAKQQLYDLRHPAPPPPTLDEKKAQKKQQIDGKTAQLIGNGFVHNNESFSLSSNAQTNWANVYMNKDSANLTYPLPVSKKDDSEYQFADAAEVDNFYWTGFAVIKTHIDSGRALKVQVDACTTNAEVDAITDNR